MTKAIAHTYTLAHEYRLHMAYALCATAAFLLITYALNVYQVISRTVAIENIQKQTAALSSSVDALDSNFLDLSSKATPDALKTYGLTVGSVSAFIGRTTSLGTIASPAHEL